MGAQHQVLDPVGRRPARSAARSQTDAPGRAAIGDDLLGQRLQLRHGRGHFVPGVGKVVRRIPDQRLHVGLVGEGIKRLCPILAFVGAKLRPVRARSIILGQPGLRLVTKRCNKPLAHQLGNQTRLRQDGDVGRAACLRVDEDLLFIPFGRRIIDLHAGRGAEIGQNGFNQNLILAPPGTKDRQRLAIQIGRLVKRLVAVPIETAFAHWEFQVLRSRVACKQSQRRSTGNEFPCHSAFLPFSIARAAPQSGPPKAGIIFKPL